MSIQSLVHSPIESILFSILGPYSTGWAFSQVGKLTFEPWYIWHPIKTNSNVLCLFKGLLSGSLLFIFLGIAAFYAGMQLWHMYLNLDSYEYPIKTYSDLTRRIFGKFASHVVNVLQTIQLMVLTATIILPWVSVYLFVLGFKPMMLQKCSRPLANIEGTCKSFSFLVSFHWTNFLKVCFSLLAVIWTLVGMVLGQIRSLKSFSGMCLGYYQQRK